MPTVEGIPGAASRIEWQSVNVMPAALIRISRSETEIPHAFFGLRDRHSGQHTLLECHGGAGGLSGDFNGTAGTTRLRNAERVSETP